MAAKVPTRPKLKDFHTTKPKDYELWATLVSIKARKRSLSAPLNDRARIVLAVSILDQHLQTALLSHFSVIDEESKTQMDELFDGERAPLGSFSSRIRIAYALGVFGPKTKKDLERLKAIRNACAHSRLHVHFKDKTIGDECTKFNALSVIKWGGVMGPEPTTTERRFFAVVEHYFHCLVVEELEGQLPTPLRYRLARLGPVFS
jgi:DNA-binding MltR family transcriptional regulator